MIRQTIATLALAAASCAPGTPAHAAPAPAQIVEQAPPVSLCWAGNRWCAYSPTWRPHMPAHCWAGNRWCATVPTSWRPMWKAAR